MEDSTRDRTLTEKGLSYSLEVKSKERKKKVKTLTEISSKLQNLLLGTNDPDIVKPLYTEWLSVYEQLLVAHEHYQKLLPSIEDQQIDDAWFQERNKTFLSINNETKKWFSLNQIVQEDVKSRYSVRSKHSSIQSNLSAARLKEEQRKAELLARAKSLKEKREIEEEKLKLKLKEEEHDIKTELEVSDAKTKVIEVLEKSILEDQELEDSLRKNEHEYLKDRFVRFEKPTVSVLNPDVPEWIPRSQQDTGVHRSSLFDNQYSIARELNKPKADIQTFNGDPMKYKGFVRQFNARVVSNTDCYEERLNFLLQFTVGEPNRIVTGFSHLDAEKGYNAAFVEFEERYGDPDAIAHAYVKRALDWPVIKQDNSKALDDFAIFLQECRYAVENVDAARILEYSENIKHLVQKLPFYMHDKWRNIVYETKGRREIVKFNQLVDFVRKEAKKANDPVYGKDILGSKSYNKRSYDNNTDKSSNLPGARKNFSISTSETPATSSSSQNDGVNKVAFTKPCMFCKGSSHSFDICKTIMKKSLKDRYMFLKSKGLCFACLKPGHQKSTCRSKLSCSICQKTHPTVFHVDPRDTSQTSENNKLHANEHVTQATNFTTHTGAGHKIQQALPIVPVKVKAYNSDKYINTYAFLDSGSTATFCSEGVMEALNLKGKKTQINLCTMGQEKVEDCYMISGLEICDLNCNVTLSLPPIFTRPILPVSRKDIVSTNDLLKWPHLSGIPLDRIHSDIGLLIGINVPRAMEPWDVIPSVDNSPFAVKTVLGWVINGPLDILNVTDQESTGHSFRTHVSVNRISAFSVMPSLDDQLRQCFNLDFSERSIDDVEEPSKEDKHFLDIVSNSTLCDGHFVIDLPFKSDDIRMPNNRKQAEQRLKSLAKRLEQDEAFREQYVAFMDKVIGDGYAERVPDEELDRDDGRSWYLPHHGVFHPKKKKLRVVFDCAAKYKGMSLNDKLDQI